MQSYAIASPGHLLCEAGDRDFHEWMSLSGVGGSVMMSEVEAKEFEGIDLFSAPRLFRLRKLTTPQASEAA